MNQPQQKIEILESEAREILQSQLDKRIPFYDQINIFLQQIKHTFIDKKPGVTKEFDLLYDVLSKTMEIWDKFQATVRIADDVNFITYNEERTREQIKARTEKNEQNLNEKKVIEKKLNTSVSFYDPYLIGSIFTVNPLPPFACSEELPPDQQQTTHNKTL